MPFTRATKTRLFFQLAASGLLSLVTACSSLLPVASDTTRVPWARFDDARLAIEQLEPDISRRSELMADGFDPYHNPAVTILSWPDLLQRFANINATRGNELDHGLQRCLVAGKRCSGLSINVRKPAANGSAISGWILWLFAGKYWLPAGLSMR